MASPNIPDLFVAEDTSIRRVIETIDRSGRLSLALLNDADGRLVSTITDGDVRRGFMAGFGLDAPLKDILPIKERLPHRAPVTAPVGTLRSAMLALMQAQRVRQLPLCDGDGRVKDVVLLADLLPSQEPAMQAVIMAGGFGKRLHPLTKDLPKPMLNVGGRPVMERTVQQLKSAGIDHIVITTHFEQQKIVDYFGDGRAFDVQLEYVCEDQPLGTGGALALMPPPREPTLVINGDVVTQVDFRALLAYHDEHSAIMTVGVRHYGMQVPYGVVQCEGNRVLSVNEKPSLNFFVNAGIYLLAPEAFSFIPKTGPFHMTDVITLLNAAGKIVVSFPILEYWLDIGRPEDFQKAQRDAQADSQGDQNVKPEHLRKKRRPRVSAARHR